MKEYKEGDILICIRQIDNMMGWPLFNEGEEYEVLHIDDDEVFLNHVLYGNELSSRTIEYVKENFRYKSEIREEKINDLLK